MPKLTKEEEEDITRLSKVRPWFVSLVDFGANHGGKDHRFALKNADAAKKRVPDKDATSEDKQAALVERSESYGIEARDDAKLSYPADYPTKESAYGDPVNLMYPSADASNAVDLGRVRNALARFKQNYEEYKKDTSRARVYERIVRSALDNGVEVSFDPEDPVDALLPADLKEELQKAAADETKMQLAAVALRAEIADLGARLVEKSEPDPPSIPVTTPTLDEIDALRATVKTATDSVDTLKEENTSLVSTLKKLETKLTTTLANQSRLQRPTTKLAGMHPNGEDETKKQTGGVKYPLRYTGRE